MDIHFAVITIRVKMTTAFSNNPWMSIVPMPKIQHPHPRHHHYPMNQSLSWSWVPDGWAMFGGSTPSPIGGMPVDPN
jgi:hypothetical protein